MARPSSRPAAPATRSSSTTASAASPDGNVRALRRPVTAAMHKRRSEQAEGVGFEAAELVVVDLDPVDAACLGQDARLRRDHLSAEDAAHGPQHWIVVERVEAPRQLLDAVDLA